MEFEATSRNTPIRKPDNNYLERILQSRDKITQARKNKISFAEPIITMNEYSIIFPNTINAIQGKAGVHKSRLAEILCSAMLKTQDCMRELLGFTASPTIDCAVCYVDTERNLSDQFPAAMQHILTKSGHKIEDDLDNFDHISLMEFERTNRFHALEEYIHHVREKYKQHIVIVLDVITDCIQNFNDTTESLKLIDLMNNCINNHNVTFICLIHENPGTGSEKARGHLGTELANKASTVIQVGFEKDRNGNSLEAVKIQFLKCRSTRRHDPIYAVYDEQERGLILADPVLVRDVTDQKRKVAGIEEVTKQLRILLTGPMTKQEVMSHLKHDLNCGVRILEDRLKEVIEEELEITNVHGEACRLTKFRQGSSNLLSYRLTPLNSASDTDIRFSE